jgi:hypothetical protein
MAIAFDRVISAAAANSFKPHVATRLVTRLQNLGYAVQLIPLTA